MFPISDTKTSGKFPFWVLVLIIINSAVFLLELTSPNPDDFVSRYALIPFQLNFSSLGNLMPLITSQFLHGGFVHIISNMWFLWIFGDNIEEKFGSLLFPIIYLLAGIVGGLTHFVFNPYSDIPMLGASGAIAGVLGAYLVFFPKHNIRTLIPVFGLFTVNMPAYIMLFIWFFTQLFNGSASIISTTTSLGGIAFFAHIGGFVSGLIVAKIYKAK